METSASAIDLVRVACLVVGSMLVAANLVVVAAYFVAWRRHKRMARAHEIPAWRGLLPLHVVAISTSYTLLVLNTMYALATHLRDEPTWRSLFYLVCYSLGFVAMWIILGYSRRREGVDASPDR